MYPPISGSSALGGSGGGKDPGRPVSLPSGHALDVILEDVLGVILEFLQRSGWLALRATSQHLRSAVDGFLLAPANFERVLRLGERRADLVGWHAIHRT